MIEDDELQNRLDGLMERYSEHNEDAVDGCWDWFVVGGRWGGSWILKDGEDGGPIATEPSTFGMRTCDRTDCGRMHTDCARLGQLEAESLKTPYSWIEQGGTWRTKWLGREASGSDDTKDWEIDDETWSKEWFELIQHLHEDTWMILIDCHQ